MAEWQPIKTAPRDGTIFLAVNARGVCNRKSMYFLCFSDTKNGPYAEGAGWRRPGRTWPAYPTHWVPLPDPPK